MKNTLHSPPFIKKFKTRDHHYIYDVNSNRLIRVDPLAYELIDEIHHLNLEQALHRYKSRFSPQRIRESCDELLRLKSGNDLFSSHRPGIASGFESDPIGVPLQRNYE